MLFYLHNIGLATIKLVLGPMGDTGSSIGILMALSRLLCHSSSAASYFPAQPVVGGKRDPLPTSLSLV